MAADGYNTNSKILGPNLCIARQNSQIKIRERRRVRKTYWLFVVAILRVRDTEIIGSKLIDSSSPAFEIRSVRSVSDEEILRDINFLLENTGTDDAGKILSNDGACPICDQVLSKSLMKAVDINPNDEWTNKELEMQYKLNKIVTQCRQKCEAMQEKFTEKMEQVHTAYQKMAKRCQMMEQEIESLSKDKQELQEKFAEKSRQKRKLDEMYDQLRSEYDAIKRSAIQPANDIFSRAETDLFASPANMMDNRDPLRQARSRSVLTPETPGQREDMWPGARQKNSNSGQLDVSSGSPMKPLQVPNDIGNKRGGRSLFGTAAGNPSSTLRNLIISPMKRPQLSRTRPHMFTL
ncbi:hypothetical protein C5167_039701 [Papaver somniferum]|uniref:E3 ubiquitin-protein ligase CCNB1IP1 homolog n=1 Tax=Papaver somniferum TaxID=3469 RepID=A0A4Y7IFD4_PAPSO|nr:hypothetical protein C5167_039701 [Papaver somniferum]